MYLPCYNIHIKFITVGWPCHNVMILFQDRSLFQMFRSRITSEYPHLSKIHTS